MTRAAEGSRPLSPFSGGGRAKSLPRHVSCIRSPTRAGARVAEWRKRQALCTGIGDVRIHAALDLRTCGDGCAYNLVDRSSVGRCTGQWRSSATETSQHGGVAENPGGFGGSRGHRARGHSGGESDTKDDAPEDPCGAAMARGGFLSYPPRHPAPYPRNPGTQPPDPGPPRNPRKTPDSSAAREAGRPGSPPKHPGTPRPHPRSPGRPLLLKTPEAPGSAPEVPRTHPRKIPPESPPASARQPRPSRDIDRPTAPRHRTFG